MNYVSIDRFEGDFAICVGDDEHVYVIKTDKLSKNCSEGDVFRMLKDGFKFDEKETIKRKNEIYDMQKKLFEEY